MLNLVLSLSLSHTGHWKFNMAPHGKELSEDLKKTNCCSTLRWLRPGIGNFGPPGLKLPIPGVGYKKIAKTLKLSASWSHVSRAKP